MTLQREYIEQLPDPLKRAYRAAYDVLDSDNAGSNRWDTAGVVPKQRFMSPILRFFEYKHLPELLQDCIVRAAMQ